MLKSILSTERDVKESALIEKRRLAEIERKKRFFDAKQRILGIDSEALDHQLAEKQQKRAHEAEEERKRDEELKLNLKIAQEKDFQIQEEKKHIEKEINEYRKEFQKPNDRHEYDLYDKCGMKKSIPARMDDNDPRLSISGGQLFIGEDLTAEQRAREQKKLQKNSLDQQIMEKRKYQETMKRCNDTISETMFQQDLHSMFMSDKKDQDKRVIMRQIREYNENLAKQKRENDLKKKQQEDEDNLAEIYNLLSSDLLKEKTDSTSNLGPNRIIPYMYKGMTKEDYEKLAREKQDQIADLCKRRQEEEHLKEKWDQFSHEMNHQMTLKERELSRNIRNMNVRVRQENENLAVEQKEKEDYINNVVNTNEPTEEFFDQFNTTSR